MRLLVFGLVAVAAFGIGFLLFNVDQSRILIRRYGYYAIALTFAWGVMALFRVRGALRDAVTPISRREAWQTAGVIAACVLVAALTTPIGYKILFDEMVLQATASNLHQYREVSTVMRAYTVDGVFVPLDSYLDKRPYFFAFLLSLVHDLTGYREANAFAFNIALMGLVLGQVYLIVRRFAAHTGGLLAVVTLGTLSTLAHSATGAGMEMLNLAMILLVAQLAIVYLDAPDESRLAALVIAAVLLAQTRYESSLYVVPVALVGIDGWRRAGRVIMPPAAIVAPALLIPYAVHNTYLSGTPMLWELHDEVQSRFGLAHFGTNLGHAAHYFFNTTANITNSLWLSVGGFAALGFVAFRLWRARRSWRTAPPAAIVLPAVGVAVVGNLALLMFYYWGQLDDPTVARLGLPFAVMLAIAVGFAIHQADRSGVRLGWTAGCCAILAYLWSGLIANAQHTRLNTLDTEMAWERRYVEAMPPGDRLVITNKSPLPWMISRIPAIGIDHARRRVDALRFQLANQTFRDVLVFQKFRPTGAEGAFQLDPVDRLPDWFVLEPLAEHRFGTRIDRVSRLVEIRPDPSGESKDERAKVGPAAEKHLPATPNGSR